MFDDELLRVVKSFSPDVIRVDAEWWQLVAFQVRYWSRRLGVPYVIFTWENLRRPWLEWHRRVLRDAALVVAGNREAEELAGLYNDNVVRLFQVGIRSDIFAPLKTCKQHDLLFVGRWTPEKGVSFIDRLIEDGYDVLKARNCRYEEMPLLYNSSRVLLVPSIRTPSWMEQAPMAVVEAALCNLDVIAFDSGSMRGNFADTGAVYFVDEGDYAALRRAVDLFLRSDDLPVYPSQRDRMLGFDHVHVAEKFLSYTREILSHDQEEGGSG